MKKLAVLALGVLAAACSETPTEAPLDSADMLAMQAAQTETRLIDFDECQDLGDIIPGLVFCVDQSGLVQRTLTSSGVSSFVLTNWTSEVTVYLFGELESTNYSEIKLNRNLRRDGDLVVLHVDSCSELSVPGGPFSATTFLHVANGEVRFEVETDEGCGA